jgi:hypothetical protein
MDFEQQTDTKYSVELFGFSLGQPLPHQSFCGQSNLFSCEISMQRIDSNPFPSSATPPPRLVLSDSSRLLYSIASTELAK